MSNPKGAHTKGWLGSFPVVTLVANGAAAAEMKHREFGHLEALGTSVLFRRTSAICLSRRRQDLVLTLAMHAQRGRRLSGSTATHGGTSCLHRPHGSGQTMPYSPRLACMQAAHGGGSSFPTRARSTCSFTHGETDRELFFRVGSLPPLLRHSWTPGKHPFHRAAGSRLLHFVSLVSMGRLSNDYPNDRVKIKG